MLISVVSLQKSARNLREKKNRANTSKSPSSSARTTWQKPQKATRPEDRRRGDSQDISNPLHPANQVLWMDDGPSRPRSPSREADPSPTSDRPSHDSGSSSSSYDSGSSGGGGGGGD